MADLITRMHFHDNDGLPDQLEVISAPAEVSMSLHLLVGAHPTRVQLWWGDTFVFGTEGLGEGRVAYRVVGWERRALLLHRHIDPLPCCDMHNEHCEPPSELCCDGCTEIGHPEHRDGGTCVLSEVHRG